MDNKYLPSPWQRLMIPQSFSEVIKVDSVRTVIYGPFAVSLEYKDESNLNLEKIWPDHAHEYALYLEKSTMDEEKLWSWYSNRNHYFLPDHSAYFQDNILHFVCTTQSERFQHVSFRSLNDKEWVDFLGNDLPKTMEERVKLISKKYW